MQTDEQKIRIKIPILTPVILAVLILLSFSILGVFWLQRRNNIDRVRMKVEETRLFYDRYLDTDVRLMNGIFDFIKEKGDLKDAWLAKDRDKLLELAKPIFESIRSKCNVTHLYFHDLDRTCFLRVHNPAKYGDFITRPTMDSAHEQKQPAWGTEFGPYGTFTLRVVHPWLIDGKLSGYIELGEEVSNILPVLKDILGVELFVTVNKRYLTRADWEEGMRMMGRENANWDLLSKSVIVDSTFENLSEESLQGMEVIGRHDKSLFDVVIKHRSYKGGFVPLVDAGHLYIGDIVVMKDVTQMDVAVKLFSIMLTSVCIIVGVVLWAMFYVYIRHIESKLTGVYIDLHDQVEKRRQADEELQRAYDRMELNVAERTSELSKEVAERKKTEHVLQELNKELETTIKSLTTANQELEQFAFITSHHLREPVRKISIFGRLLANSLVGNLDNDQRENLNFMIDGANKIEQMVKGLKLYLQTSTDKMEFEDVDLNLILEKIKRLDLVAELEQTHGTILVPRKLLVISGCSVQIRQVMQQIIANSLRYRQEGISPEIVVQAYRENNETVRIEIEDNGIGIKEEYLGDIFNPFRCFQAEHGSDGVGIGLTVCKKIIKRHGGEMGIRSVYGHGTTIWFTLSLAASETGEKITVSDSANS
jgi:signal transduction histidine kinase